MLPSSSIAVVGQSADRLEILDPPRYTTAVLAIVLAVVYVLVLLFFQKRRGLESPFPWEHLVAPLVIFLIGTGLLTSFTRITFSRSLGNATIKRRYFGIALAAQYVSLGSVRSATVETRRGYSQRIVLVLRSGEPMPLGRFTGQAGHYDAANAINDFLGHPSSP
jgi:hypothetical protein